MEPPTGSTDEAIRVIDIESFRLACFGTDTAVGMWRLMRTSAAPPTLMLRIGRLAKRVFILVFEAIGWMRRSYLRATGGSLYNQSDALLQVVCQRRGGTDLAHGLRDVVIMCKPRYG